MNHPKNKKLFGHIEVPLKRIHIELTNICNFDCVFCPKNEMERPPGSMDVDLAKGIIDTVKTNDICEKITFHVMGEPTLHPKFFEILDYAGAQDVNVGLTTNGTGLTGKAGRRLVDYDLHQIDVSLQTPDEKSFKLRKAGKISFDDYVDGILGFLSAYNIREKKTTFNPRRAARYPKYHIHQVLPRLSVHHRPCQGSGLGCKGGSSASSCRAVGSTHHLPISKGTGIWAGRSRRAI